MFTSGLRGHQRTTVSHGIDTVTFSRHSSYSEEAELIASPFQGGEIHVLYVFVSIRDRSIREAKQGRDWRGSGKLRLRHKRQGSKALATVGFVYVDHQFTPSQYLRNPNHSYSSLQYYHFLLQTRGGVTTLNVIDEYLTT